MRIGATAQTAQHHVEVAPRTPPKTTVARSTTTARSTPVRSASTLAPRTDTLELSSRTRTNTPSFQVYDRKGNVRSLGTSNNDSATKPVNMWEARNGVQPPTVNSKEIQQSAQGVDGSKNGSKTSQVKVDLPWAGQVNANNVSGPTTRFEMPIPTKQEAKEGIIGAAGLGLLTVGAAAAPAVAGALGLTGEATSAASGAEMAAGAAMTSQSVNDAASARMAQEAAMKGATPVQPEVANAGYSYPPYDTNYPIVDRPTQSGESFVHFSSSSGQTAGRWLIKASDAEGMTADQIRSTWNIPTDINVRTDANLPEGTTIRVGVANGNGPAPFNQTGQGVQYRIMEEPDASWFTNPTPLGK